jgi:hypothetical protein
VSRWLSASPAAASTLASKITPPPSAQDLRPSHHTHTLVRTGGRAWRGEVSESHSLSLFPPLQKDSLSQTYGLSRSSREAVSWRFRRPPMPYAWEENGQE